MKDDETMKMECIEDVRGWLTDLETRGITTKELDLRVDLLRAVCRHLTESAPVTTKGYDLENLYPFPIFPLFKPPFGGQPGTFPGSET